MDLIHVAAALLSALLHAGWNAVVKASRNPTQAMTAQMIVSGLIVVPGLIWSGLPAPASWGWIAASTVLNLLTVSALLRAYEAGGFGIVYPLMRAVAVLLVAPLAAALAGERIGAFAFIGVVIIAVALAALAFDAMRGKAITLPALGWTLAAGAGVAAYILCDAQGVRAAGSPWSYGFAIGVTNAVAMGWRQIGAGAPWTHIRAQWVIALPASVASVASYLLILWVWGHGPIAPASALRDTSAVFAILIAIVWLKEPFTLTRVVAVLLTAAAVPLLRLG